MTADVVMIDVRGAGGHYTRFRRVRAKGDKYCFVCRKHGAVRDGDRRFVRLSDSVTNICLGCEASVIERATTRIIVRVQ